MLSHRRVIAITAAAATLMVAPAGWPASAAEQIPAVPDTALNEAWTPPTDAAAGVAEVGEAPEQAWTLTSEEAPGVPAGAGPTPVPQNLPSSRSDPVLPDLGAPENSGADSRNVPDSEPGGGASINSAPAGTAVGAPGLGALPWFSFDEIPLTTDTVARVNLGNGNLLLTSNDGQLNGPALTLRNDRFYNGLSTAEGAFGGGWSSSLSAVDVGLQIGSSAITFRGPSGFQAVFTLSGGSWIAPAGFAASLVAQGSGWKLTYNESGEQLIFNGSGWPGTSIATASAPPTPTPAVS